MVNDRNDKRKGVLIVVSALFALFAAAILIFALASGNSGASAAQSLKNKITSSIPFLNKSSAREVSFFMENGRGTYNLVELSIPAGGTSSMKSNTNDNDLMPVVLMAHGFAGTLHSGGASELGARLAEKGVLAARIDFDPYVKPDKSAEQTHVYPLSQMTDDAVELLDLIVRDYGGDPDNISLYGRSYGGRLVMRMANESSGGYDYQKLALVAPAGDAVAFRRYLGGEKKYKEIREEAFSAADKAGDNAVADNAVADNAGADGDNADNAGADNDDADQGTGENGDDDTSKNHDLGKAGNDVIDIGAFPQKLGVYVTPQWFKDVESYDPTEFGWKFGDKPVLLFYNTLDTVVYPDTSIRCAESYKNHEIVEVTTKDGHGYEMGYKHSKLKNEIMDKLVSFLAE
ncbi:MAG: alpha/beta hydrolase [Eubacterium sp.]|nr:alpha/beta hydrolase [Eubacterium sp.]